MKLITKKPMSKKIHAPVKILEKRAYEKNRKRLKKTREESADPDRFQWNS